MVLDVTEKSAGVRGVLLLSRPSCLSQWKVLFWWNQWKEHVEGSGSNKLPVG